MKPYFLESVALVGGVPLDSHDDWKRLARSFKKMKYRTNEQCKKQLL